MVLSDFLSRHITHLQSHVRLSWQYTGEGNTTWLERGQGSNFAPDVQRTLLSKLSPDPSSTGFTTCPTGCTPLCSNQVIRRRMLQELPTLDEIGIDVRQKGDESQGVQIPGMDIADGPIVPSAGPDTSKRKGKVVTPICSDDKMSSTTTTPIRGGGGCSTAMGTPSAGPHQQGSRLRRLSLRHFLTHRQ
jgi:hypothetical protein